VRQAATSNRRMLILLVGCSLLLAASLWLGQDLLKRQDNDTRLFAPQPCDPSQLQPQLQPQLQSQPHSQRRLEQQGCNAQREKQQVHFFIDSAEISSQAPIPFRVKLQGFEPQRVEIELQGRDMYMGETRFTLVRGEDGQYRGHGQLPVCTTGMMTWRARVWITEAAATRGSWFDFLAR
tara:strand:+ start:12126 stop:12662 length:537 start_codon:yes stop_codon:yes gene_type:complete